MLLLSLSMEYLEILKLKAQQYSSTILNAQSVMWKWYICAKSNAPRYWFSTGFIIQNVSNNPRLEYIKFEITINKFTTIITKIERWTMYVLL